MTTSENKPPPATTEVKAPAPGTEPAAAAAAPEPAAVTSPDAVPAAVLVNTKGKDDGKRKKGDNTKPKGKKAKKGKKSRK